MINEAPWNLWKLKTWGIKSPWKELKDGTNLIAVAQFVCIKKSAQGSKIEIAEKVRNEGKNELLYQLKSHAVAKQKELDFYLNFPWITSAMQLQCNMISCIFKIFSRAFMTSSDFLRFELD